MNTFIDFLLDTETTSDVLFNETIVNKTTYYDRRYLSNYEKIVDRKLQQCKDYYQKEQRAIAERLAINAGNESSEESSKSNSEDEVDEEDDKADKKDVKPSRSTTQVRDLRLVNIYSVLEFI